MAAKDTVATAHVEEKGAAGGAGEKMTATRAHAILREHVYEASTGSAAAAPAEFIGGALAHVKEAVLGPLEHLEGGKKSVTFDTAVLLTGPSGTGKTTAARQQAYHAGVTFIYFNASELTSVELVNVMFDEAIAKAPALVFVDQIDTLITGKGDAEVRGVFAARLAALPKTVTKREEYVVVMCATNAHLTGEAAAMFHKRVEFKLPTAAERETAIKHLLVRIAADKDIDVGALVEASSHFTMSDVHKALHSAMMAPLHDVVDRMKREGVPIPSNPTELSTLTTAWMTENGVHAPHLTQKHLADAFAHTKPTTGGHGHGHGHK